MTHRARRIGPRLWNRTQAMTSAFAPTAEQLRRAREARIVAELQPTEEDPGAPSVSEDTRTMLEEDRGYFNRR